MSKELAVAILAAMQAHEDSYDHGAAAVATAANDQKRARMEMEGNAAAIYCIVDYRQFYRMDLRQAVESVVHGDLVEPVYLLLTTAWNDIADWAKAVVGKENFRFIVGIDRATEPHTQDIREVSVQMGADDELQAAMKIGQSYEMALTIKRG